MFSSNLMCMPSRPRKFCTNARTVDTHVEWFSENVNLAKKRENLSTPHFVFLEGSAGSNKGPVLGRLAKIGYTTGGTNFLQLLRESKGDITSSAKVFQSKLENFVEKHLRDFEKGARPKENLILFNRSLLSCFHLSPNEARKILEEICNDNFSIVLCNTDTIARKQRLGLAMFEADSYEQSLRKLLGEEDDTTLEKSLVLYDKYLKAGLIDHQIFTTSSRQGAMAILHTFGIKAKVPNYRESYTDL